MSDKINFAEITRKASRTFYLSSLLFPRKVRNDIFILYSFVRTMDDLIDTSPPDIMTYQNYRQQTLNSLSGIKSENTLIEEFVIMTKRKEIPKEWIFAFFGSLEIDEKNKSYKNFEELKKFIYGVAEVIGLMIAKIINLPKKSYPMARSLGESMQLINILRDIDEDLLLGRVYLPQDEMKRFHIKNLFHKDKTNQLGLKEIIKFQICRINLLQKKAVSGFKYIPSEYLVAIKTASDIYFLISQKINHNPLFVMKKRVKPSLWEVISIMLKNFIVIKLVKKKYE